MPPTTLIQNPISNMRLLQLVRHPDLLAALVCALLLVVVGWFTLNLGWINLSLVILHCG